MFREGLRKVLQAEPDLVVCGEVASAAEALAAATTTRPDVAIVDITLDHSSGIDLIKDLELRWPGLPVLVLSNHDEALYAERCLRAGARGYVMKHHPPEHLIEAVHNVLQGKFHFSGEITNKILSQCGHGAVASAGHPAERLSDRELQVFELYGKGRTTRQIATFLHLSVKTIESHRDHIKEKLGFTDSAGLVHAAVQWVESQGGL
ncbi:MAG: response regulator transcription factor [Acidobacteria bacterium]|nr:response regulator transcription factor [Acidobacteriota bacterium]